MEFNMLEVHLSHLKNITAIGQEYITSRIHHVPHGLSPYTGIYVS